MQLVIGNKNYSSWSMRPWVLMKGLGLPFEERQVSFKLGMGAGFAQAMAPISPARRVPVLLDEGFAVWDSLAITEYLHDKLPEHGIWPTDMRRRARARSICAEMHAGFGALRTHCPMNIEAHLPDDGARVYAQYEGVRGDLNRIEAMWTEALAASGGPFLFGNFSGADAFYAPVASRIKTYALPVSGAALAYAERLLASPGPAAWVEAALGEHEFIAEDEPYRQDPTTR
ncbi:MAG TPA: glutathione S-transferase family protein [Rubrivivax sp.]|nr:glutathione S-transferase family protein [Rubrivivax sp.]